MSEVTLIEVIQPFLNVLGGFAGLTILYFILVLWQNKKKINSLQRIESEQERAKERDKALAAEQRRITRSIQRLDAKVTRWKAMSR